MSAVGPLTEHRPSGRSCHLLPVARSPALSPLACVVASFLVRSICRPPTHLSSFFPSLFHLPFLCLAIINHHARRPCPRRTCEQPDAVYPLQRRGWRIRCCRNDLVRRLTYHLSLRGLADLGYASAMMRQRLLDLSDPPRAPTPRRSSSSSLSLFVSRALALCHAVERS